METTKITFSSDTSFSSPVLCLMLKREGGVDRRSPFLPTQLKGTLISQTEEMELEEVVRSH